MEQFLFHGCGHILQFVGGGTEETELKTRNTDEQLNLVYICSCDLSAIFLSLDACSTELLVDQTVYFSQRPGLHRFERPGSIRAVCHF